MAMTLSRLSMPSTRLCSPGGCFDLYTCCISDFSRISLTRVDLPDPDTPVMAVNTLVLGLLVVTGTVEQLRQRSPQRNLELDVDGVG